jgi:hypothetical protein
MVSPEFQLSNGYAIKPGDLYKNIPCWKVYFDWLPEIMKVFWLTFVFAIVGVTAISFFGHHDKNGQGSWFILTIGIIAFLLAASAHIYYGKKWQSICKAQIGKENK